MAEVVLMDSMYFFIIVCLTKSHRLLFFDLRCFANSVTLNEVLTEDHVERQCFQQNSLMPEPAESFFRLMLVLLSTNSTLVGPTSYKKGHQVTNRE